MKAYNFWRDAIMPGFPVFYCNDEPGILLGEHRGPNRYMRFHNFNPPILHESEGGKQFMHDAYPVYMKSKATNASFYVLAEPEAKHEGDRRVLVRYSTQWDADNHTGFEGYVICEDRDSQILQEYVVRGQYREGVARLSPGSILKLQYNNENMEPRAIYVPEEEGAVPETGFFAAFLMERAYANPNFTIEDTFAA